MSDWLKILKDAIGNLTGDMSAVALDEAASLAAYAKYAREMSRGHNQTRICLIVPDLANLASDAPNTAIKAELDKIATVAVLDEAGVDDGQEDWDFYDTIVVGSDTYDPFVLANLDSLILLKVPVMVCNSAVADHLRMGTDTTQSANTVNEWCKSIHNRVMYLVFGSTGDKALFSEATLSDRLDMSDASLTPQLLMTSLTGDTNTTAVVGWLPQDTGVGVTNTLDDDTDLPACRLFAGCFVNADKLTALGQLLFRSMTRNFAQAGLSPSITLKASAAQVAAILNDTADMQPKLGAPAADISADIAAIKLILDTPANFMADLTTLEALVGAIDATTTDSLHGKLGTDTELADYSFYDLLGGNAFKTNALSAMLGAFTTAQNLKAILGNLTTTKNLGGILGALTTTDNLKGILGAYTTAANLKAAIDAIQALIDSGESAGPFSYLDAGAEQTVKEDTATTRRRISLEFSNRNMTQTGTFIIYRKVDGANYDVYATVPCTIGAGDDRAWDIEFTTNQAWKLTYEEDVNEGATRAIPYNVITQVIE